MAKLEAAVIISDEVGKGGSVHHMDVIEYEGHAWLVPEWHDYLDAKVTMPVRIVLLDTIPHGRMPAPPQYVVSFPVPKCVFEGRVPPALEAQYVVIERPDIRLPLPDATH